MQIPTNYKMGTGLAATMLGQENAQESERQTLANLGQIFQNQKSEYEGAEAQAKLQDPRYMQMKLQADMSKFGKETSINEIETSYNKATRAVAHLQAAAAMGPQALQQAALGYLQEMDIDPNSEKGRILLQDPIGNAQKTAQFFATAATNNPEYLRQHSLENVKGEWGMKKQESANEAHLAGQRISAGATLQAAKLRSSNEKINEQAADAIRIANDPKASPEDRLAAQQFLQDLTVYRQSGVSGFAGSDIGPGGWQPKAEGAPKFSWQTQKSGRPSIDSFDK